MGNEKTTRRKPTLGEWAISVLVAGAIIMIAWMGAHDFMDYAIERAYQKMRAVETMNRELQDHRLIVIPKEPVAREI